MSSERWSAFQHFRHVALDDALGQALGDRGLADAGIADIERIVLLAAAQHLDGAVDFARPISGSIGRRAFWLRLTQ
jgi:hypothetical protein